MIEILALCGVLFIIEGLVIAGILAFSFLRDFIEDKRYEYEIAHRFDKKPTAKCYCKDCVLWDEDNEQCRNVDKFASDCGFCWNAKPRKRN